MAKNKGTEERVKAWVAELLALEEQDEVLEGRRETIVVARSLGRIASRSRSRFPRSGASRRDGLSSSDPRPPPRDGGALTVTVVQPRAPESLHGALGYVTPADQLAGRAAQIFTERKPRLDEARRRRRAAHHEALREVALD